MITKEKTDFIISAMDKTAAGSFRPWTELKQNPVYQMIERYRTKSLPLPTEISNPFPESFGFVDYTNVAIEAINKRGRYLTMDELDQMAAPTSSMQEAVKDSLKAGKDGGIIGAPAGYGKSFTFQYLGIMAAERSLSHTYLWFRGGALIKPDQLKNQASIREYHFMFTDAKNLSQTGGLWGGATGPQRELTQAAQKDPDRFVLCLDELYTALSQEADAAGGWFALKGLTEPDPLVKIIGTMASVDVPGFKKLKVTQMVGQGQEGIQKPVYDGQLKSRFHNTNVPDFTREEQLAALEKGSLNRILTSKGLNLDYDPKDKQSIIQVLVDRTDDIERGKAPADRVWAAPRKWKSIIADANTTVIDRQETYSPLIADVEFLRKTSDLSNWQAAYNKLESEEQAISGSSEDSPETPSGTAMPGEEDAGIISIRDTGGKFPHEEVETPEEMTQQKRERVGDIEDKKHLLAEKMKNIQRARRYREIGYKKGLAELESKYGGGVFSPDLHDIGYLKPVDVQNVDITKLKFDEEE